MHTLREQTRECARLVASIPTTYVSCAHVAERVCDMFTHIARLEVVHINHARRGLQVYGVGRAVFEEHWQTKPRMYAANNPTIVSTC